jgi:hypothetical protein
MLVPPLALVGGTKQPILPGDIPNLFEEVNSIANAAGVTYTPIQVVSGDILRSGAVAVTDTFPTADQLVKALIGGLNKLSPPDNALYGTLPSQSVELQWPANQFPLLPGSSFRRRIISANTGILTLAVPASAGISLLGNTTLAATTWRELLIRILNSSPAVTVGVTTTNVDPKLTNVPADMIARVSPGMSVFGTGIGASAKVVAVNLDTRVITLDVNSTATADNVGVLFTPTVTVRGVQGGNVI